MKKHLYKILYAMTLLLLSGCSQAPNDETNEQAKQQQPDITFSYNFDDHMEGWVSGFSGINDHYLSMGYDINYSHGDYAYMNILNKGIYLAGNHLESDVFMYTTKRFSETDGLKSLTHYKIDLDFDALSTMITTLTDTTENQIYVKAGVLDRLPEPDLTLNTLNQVYQVTSGQGPHTDGTDLLTLGNLAIQPNKDKIYGQKSFQKSFYAKTNSNGELWVIIGTDASSQSSSSIYFDNITVAFTINE